MTQMPTGPVVTVKPRPNIYTLLVILAILALGFATFVVLHNLMNVYGMTFSELFKGQVIPS